MRPVKGDLRFRALMIDGLALVRRGYRSALYAGAAPRLVWGVSHPVLVNRLTIRPLGQWATVNMRHISWDCTFTVRIRSSLAFSIREFRLRAKSSSVIPTICLLFFRWRVRRVGRSLGTS